MKTFGDLGCHDEALAIKLIDNWQGFGDSEYADKTLETFLKDVFGDDYDEISTDEINEALDERGLQTIDFDGMAFDEVRDSFYSNYSDEEFEEELMDKL